MSDDWINLASVADRMPLRTPFGYFRPLYLASYWAEARLWGLRPFAFHSTNLLLITACAALVVLVVRRFTGDPLWAATAGILFAVHPYHVENAAWIAARGDSASTLCVLISLLVYDRWVRSERGWAFGAIVAFEAGLLFKESVALFPAMVLVLRSLENGARISRREWLGGILPLGATAILHFVVLRRVFLGDNGLALLETLGFVWIKRGVDFFTAAILPFHTEEIEAHPIVLASAALALLGALVLLARQHLTGRACQAGALILLLLATVAPSLVSFQERYFLLPSVVSCTILAYLLLHIPRRVAPLAWVFMLVIWIGSLGAHWHEWLEAGKASNRLIAGLTQASLRDHAREIVIANQPYRVAGAPVNGDLSTAVRLTGGRAVQIRAATSLDLPTAFASGIEGELRGAVQVQPTGVEVKIRLPRGRFSGIFLPLQRLPNTIQEKGYATLEFDDVGGVAVRIVRLADASRVAYAWYEGELTQLF
jgi:hypothetical protein